MKVILYMLEQTGARRATCVFILLASTCMLLPGCNAESSPTPKWTGKGSHRIIVRVDPYDIGKRKSDEMPTRIHISATDVLPKATYDRRIDVGSFEVEQFDPATGDPISYGKWAYAHAAWEVPYRWYDDSIPEDFPEVVGNIDPDTGELKYVSEKNWGYLYETLGEWRGGHLAWNHTQRGSQPSFYAIYFDLLPPGKTPDALPRRGFVGDGTERIEEKGESTHGLLLSRVEVADWNGDGLLDILVGAERGGIVWYPNRGTKDSPSYPYAKLMFTADGKPLDVGFSATPLVVDWDGDGVQDLLCGAEWNRAVWYKNVGTNKDPKLVYKGLIYTDDGKPFQLPHEPVPEGKGIYKKDYHPVLAAADLDGDGRIDLLAGGYVTGRIYFFKNMGWDKAHLPILHAEGPLTADGKPIDVGWAATPTAADFDGDGLIDIISGDMLETASGGDSVTSENFLYYFKNVGTRQNPRFTKLPFPVKGKFPPGATAAPRAADLNGDRLLDLVVVENTNLSIYMNVGTRTRPLWQYAPPLPGKWHTAPLLSWTTQVIDRNHDGNFDLIDGFTTRLNLGKGNPQMFGPTQSILGPGEKIFHKSPYGDPWSFTYVVDMDGDGKLDILYAVHSGNVYLHRNLSVEKKVHFDDGGILLKTEDGKPINVGFPPGHKWDFDVLQGARATVAAADCDGDGKVDLIVGNTSGKVRYYRNLTGGPNPVFAQPVVIADTGFRVVPKILDWNGDGWPDILIGGSTASIVYNVGKKADPQFFPAEPLKIPYLPYEATLSAVDWNQDGDMDLLARASYGYTFWFERSFLEHGYAPATPTKMETHD